MRLCHMGVAALCAQWWGMASTADIRHFLGRLILVIFMVAHAPVAGVMSVAQAHSADAGAGTLVICVDGSFKEIEAPVTPHPSGTAAHDCLCPCATLCAAGALAADTGDGVAVVLEREISSVERPHRVGLAPVQLPQTGQGSPRSPPVFFI